MRIRFCFFFKETPPPPLHYTLSKREKKIRSGVQQDQASLPSQRDFFSLGDWGEGGVVFIFQSMLLIIGKQNTIKKEKAPREGCLNLLKECAYISSLFNCVGET